MNTPEDHFDQPKLRQLASAVMDGTATEVQQQELTAILRDSAAARDEYLALVDLHAVLASELVGAASTPKVEQCSDVPSADQSWLRVSAIAALAACLLLGLTWIAMRDGDVQPIDDGQDIVLESPDDGFLSVIQLTDAEWNSAVPVEVGDRLGQETIHLKSGFVRLEFDSGVEVTLQGPAEFQLLAPEKTNLKSGLLTANVPLGAEGFTVTTPTAEVVDLGTSFGIDLREDGFSSVSVFDGEVEVAAADTTQKRLLTEGESVRIGRDREIEEVDFDAQRFEKVWPISSGIVGSSESFRFVPPWPRNIRWVESDDDIFVAAEGNSVELSKELRVNVSEPGEYTRVDELEPRDLQPGERVRSFILHYSPAREVGPRRAKRISGSITFDRPVLGLIVQHDELMASSRRFSRRRAAEAKYQRQLNLTGDAAGDRIVLSEDRKTITLDLISPGRSSDLVRVIVESAGRFRPVRARHRRRPAGGNRTNRGSQ